MRMPTPAFDSALEAVRRRKAASAEVAPLPIAVTPQSAPQATAAPSADRPAVLPAKSEAKRWDAAEDDPVDDARAPYLPTPEQIREACLAIQATWSNAERALRMSCSGLGGRRLQTAGGAP